MMLFKENDVLDILFRQSVIKEILGNENQQRKKEQFKRYEIYNDMVAKYTRQLLASQFDASTVEEMEISLTNVSLCKKIINKKSRVYGNGADRKLKGAREQKVFDEMIKHLNLQLKLKKADRYLELHNNIWIMVLPVADKDAAGNIYAYDLKLSIIPPFLFDVIEDSEDRERARCVILSNFNPNEGTVTPDTPERNGNRGAQRNMNNFNRGDSRDQTIADTPNDYDQSKQSYTWWTDSYHFVTDVKGHIISEGDGLNPIGEIPGVSLNKDQDGNYYSISGNDLVDSCLLANAMMTNINHIGIQQGYGQAFIIGKNLPQQMRLGPTKIVKLEASSEGESPSFGFASSNPPLEQLKDLTVTQIALLLSTNNLSTSNVKVDLESGQSFASGVSLLIDRAELIEDIQDRRDVFLYCEVQLFKIISDWLNLYGSKSILCDELKGVTFDPEGLTIKFNEVHTIVSEKEKLDNLKLRKDLGLNTMAELLQLDNPDMSEEEINAKLLELTQEKQKAMLEQQAMMGENKSGAAVDSDKSKQESDMYVDENQVMWKKTDNGFEKVN